MRRHPVLFNEWNQFWFTEIYPLCALIGALVGAYYGYKYVEGKLNLLSAFGVFMAAVGGAIAGALVGGFILSIPYLAIVLAISAAAIYGVWLVGKVLYHLFGDEPKPLTKPSDTPSIPVAPIAPVVQPTVKIQAPAPESAYQPKEPTEKLIDLDFVTGCVAIFVLCLLFIFISTGSNKKAPAPSTSISQSATPEPKKRVVERIVVREHDEPACVNHNRVIRYDSPTPAKEPLPVCAAEPK